MRWGRDPIRLPKTPLEKKRICAGYAPATFLARHLDPAGIPPDSIWSKGMRQGYALGTRPHWPSQTVSRKQKKNGYAPGMRQPHSSLVIWTQLEHKQDLAGINLEQGYASGVCACQATPSASPKCLSTKNRYALGMRWPHCSLGIWFRAEHRLDSARTLVSLRNLCAGGMRPIYLYTLGEFFWLLCARLCALYIYAKSSVARGRLLYF